MTDSLLPVRHADHSAPVQLDNVEVGPHQPVFVVAEAGVNHNGQIKKAIALVDAAADAGADAVKFQVFNARALTIRNAPIAAYQRASGSSSQQDMLSKLQLSEKDFATIKAHCDQRRLFFIATPFSPEDVDVITGLGACAIKLASTDLTSTSLINRAAATDLPLIVSTGAANSEEIHQQLDFLTEQLGPGRLIALHCVSSYPTPLQSANLAAIKTLARCACVPIGLSDHTRDLRTGGWAVAAGACLLEKHMTLNNCDSGPDHAMSMEPDNLKAYIQHARDAQTAMGAGALGMTEIEKDVHNIARKSLVSHVAIPKGTTITDSMLTEKRPGYGICPTKRNSVVGRKSVVSIPADSIVSWDMIA